MKLRRRLKIDLNCRIMNNVGVLCAFVGGAVVGAGVALLFAPEKGENLRCRIKEAFRNRGFCCCEREIEALVEELTPRQNKSEV